MSLSKRYGSEGGGHSRRMVLRYPVKNRAYIRGQWIQKNHGNRPATQAVGGSEGYAALVTRLARSAIPAPHLVVPTHGENVGFPFLNPALDDGRNKAERKKTRRIKKKLRKFKREEQERAVADGLLPMREDNTYLDSDSLTIRSTERYNRNIDRFVHRAEVTHCSYAPSNRPVQPGRPRTVPDPPMAHIKIFCRHTAQRARNNQFPQVAEVPGDTNNAEEPRSADRGPGDHRRSHSQGRSRSRGSSSSSAHPVPSLSAKSRVMVQHIPQMDRDLYTPLIESTRAPLTGLWQAESSDFVRVAFDESEVGNSPTPVSIY